VDDERNEKEKAFNAVQMLANQLQSCMNNSFILETAIQRIEELVLVLSKEQARVRKLEAESRAYKTLLSNLVSINAVDREIFREHLYAKVYENQPSSDMIQGMFGIKEDDNE
jgi:hypothetical protein